MLPEDDEALILEMMQVLDLDSQWTSHVEGWDQEEIKRIRSCGRKAGKRLGRPVRTFATDPEKRKDGQSIIWVVTEPSEEDRERLEERARVLMDEIFKE
jgi:hypothetical protein